MGCGGVDTLESQYWRFGGWGGFYGFRQSFLDRFGSAFGFGLVGVGGGGAVGFGLVDLAAGQINSFKLVYLDHSNEESEVFPKGCRPKVAIK